MGGKPYQSKLEPFADLIRTLRKSRKSYHEIAQILQQEHGLVVNRRTIWSFVKVRSKPPRKMITMLEATPQVTIEPPISKPKKPLFIFDENKPLTLTNP